MYMELENKRQITPVIEVTFDDKTAEDTSGFGNRGVIVGAPEFVAGYDGNQAIYLKNPFGRSAAEQYIRFDDLKGIDLRTDDFTVMFWYKTFCGGTQEWAASWHVTQAGWGVDMPGVLLGGVVFSNRDTFDFDATGVLAAQLPLNQYFSAGVTGEKGARVDVDGIREPQDGRWHLMTAVYNRSAGYYQIYVDGEETACADIAAFAGQPLGKNSLVLGADVLGQYGLGNACVDSFQIYAGAMSEQRVRERFCYDKVKRLAGEIIGRLTAKEPDGVGLELCAAETEVCEVEREARAQKDRLYSRKNGERMAEQVQIALDELERLKNGENERSDVAKEAAEANEIYLEQLNELYNHLKKDYEAFLSEPEKKAKLTMLLMSDGHIGEVDDSRAIALKTVFADLEKEEIKLDGILNAGDFAAGASEAVCDKAYGVLNQLMEKHTDWQAISCFGNHEINYVSEEENFHTGAGAFWRNVQPYISMGTDRRFGDGVLDSVQNYSYGMTFRGVHFLVLNTDYLPQVGNAKNNWDTDALDPIRHGLFLSEESYIWLEKQLETYKKDGQPIFVISHSPFADTVPLSYFRRIRIRDNSVGPQDSRLRRLLGRYEKIVYVCGHLHLSFGITGPVTVESTEGGRFTEITLPSFQNAKRGYRRVPATWIMYVYEDRIVMRARDFGAGEWMTEYDEEVRYDF